MEETTTSDVTKEKRRSGEHHRVFLSESGRKTLRGRDHSLCLRNRPGNMGRKTTQDSSNSAQRTGNVDKDSALCRLPSCRLRCKINKEHLCERGQCIKRSSDA